MSVFAFAGCGPSESIEDAQVDEVTPNPAHESIPAGPASPDDADLVNPDQPVVQQRVDRGGDYTVLFVGDSVLVSVSDDLAARVDGNLVFDAVNCRQLGNYVSGGCGGGSGGISSGLDAIEDAMDEVAFGDEPPDVAVLVLVNNSSVTPEELDEAMELLAGVPRVWWVNARIDGFGRQDLNNLALEDLTRRNPRAEIIDWFSESDDPDLFRDHVHPNEEGQRRLADLIGDHLACDCIP